LCVVELSDGAAQSQAVTPSACGIASPRRALKASQAPSREVSDGELDDHLAQ
jgi:hypothetical protein